MAFYFKHSKKWSQQAKTLKKEPPGLANGAVCQEQSSGACQKYKDGRKNTCVMVDSKKRHGARLRLHFSLRHHMMH